jgi:prophage regulatory protein
MQLDQNTNQEYTLLRLRDVLRIVPVGKSTWWAGVKSGRHPKGIKLSPRVTVWRSDVIHAWIREQK